MYRAAAFTGRTHDEPAHVSPACTVFGDPSAAAMTCYVEWPSGRLLRMDGPTFSEWRGRVGQRVRFSD